MKQTIFHEMGHINDMVYMPNLYNYVFENSQKKTVNYILMSSLFWIEYIAEKIFQKQKGLIMPGG